MSISEAFNEVRMRRCTEMARSIMNHWAKSNAFSYVVRATESVEGLTFSDLKKQYFSVGVTEPTVDLPFLDLLVLFSIIQQQTAAMKARSKKDAKTFQLKVQIKTEFTDEEAATLLSGIQIHTPFDTGKLLRVVATTEARPNSPAD